MNYTNIPAFCINMDTRPDRWARVAPRFEALGWPVERVSGVIHAAATMHGIDGRHAGAVDSHKVAWRLCLERGHKIIAVFEDDVVFTSDFGRVFARAAAALPSTWQLWHFHCSHARAARINKYVVRIASNMWGAHGYLIRREACRDLLERVTIANIDMMLSNGYRQIGGDPLGMPLEQALCFQEGTDESNIPVTNQQAFWLKQRLRWCR